MRPQIKVCSASDSDRGDCPVLPLLKHLWKFLIINHKLITIIIIISRQCVGVLMGRKESRGFCGKHSFHIKPLYIWTTFSLLTNRLLLKDTRRVGDCSGVALSFFLSLSVAINVLYHVLLIWFLHWNLIYNASHIICIVVTVARLFVLPFGYNTYIWQKNIFLVEPTNGSCWVSETWILH